MTNPFKAAYLWYLEIRIKRLGKRYERAFWALNYYPKAPGVVESYNRAEAEFDAAVLRAKEVRGE